MQHLLAVTLNQLGLNTRLDPLWSIGLWHGFGNILCLGGLRAHAWLGVNVVILLVLLEVHLLLVIWLASVAAITHIVTVYTRDQLVAVIIEPILVVAVFLFVIFKSAFLVILFNVEGQIVVLVHYNCLNSNL